MHALKGLSEVIEKMRKEVNERSVFEFVIRRSNILEDALRRMQKSSFDPLKKLHVCIAVYIDT